MDSQVDDPSSEPLAPPSLSRVACPNYSSAGSRALNHIVGNFAMFGFGNHEAALFQTVKELVENSIDAAGPLDGRHCELAVNIYRAIEERQQCVVEVLDNGQGMSNPRAQLNCFHSDKAPNSLARVSSHGNAADRTHRSLSSSAGEMGALSCGKFGVGLSTCILYSQINTQACVRIVTKVLRPPDLPELRYASVLDVYFDIRDGDGGVGKDGYREGDIEGGTGGSGDAVVEERDPVDMPGLSSGTKIQLAMPLPLAFDQVMADISTYFARIACLPENDVTIRFSVSMGGSQSTRCTYSTRAGKYSQATSRSAPPDAAETSCCGAALRRALGDPVAEAVTGTATTRSARGAAKAVPAAGSIKPALDHAISACPGPCEADAYIHVVLADRPIRQSLDDGLPVQIWRYANNVPLINADDDALSCSLFTSLRRAPAWSRHALQLRMDADQPPALSRPSVTHISSGRGDAGSLSVFKNSPMSLRFQMDDTSAVPDAFRVKCIVLIVNVRMRNVPYTTMRKTSVGRCYEITKSVQAALLNALSAAHRILPQLFVDVKKLKDDLMLRTSIPSVARSISKIIFHSRDSSFQYECMRALSGLVNSSAAAPVPAAGSYHEDGEVLELQALQDAATDAILDVIRRQSRPARPHPACDTKIVSASHSNSQPPCLAPLPSLEVASAVACASGLIGTGESPGDLAPDVLDPSGMGAMLVVGSDTCTYTTQPDMGFSQYSQYL